MPQFDEKRVSLKKFLKLSESYDNYDRYIRLYYFEDPDQKRRLLVLTHQETKVKNPIDHNDEITVYSSHFCEIPCKEMLIHDSRFGQSNTTSYGKRPLKVFHLHHADAWNFISFLKLFHITGGDSVAIDYYPSNNSLNNTEHGLFQESMKFAVMKYKKINGCTQPLLHETYKIGIDNQFVDDLTRIIDHGDYTLNDAVKLLDCKELED